VLPVRAIYRRAIARNEIVLNPTAGLALPAVRARRERVARPDEAAALISAVPAADRAIWATALYAGLRLGELKALRWQDIDLEAGVIRVERGWDRHAGPIPPKSRAVPGGCRSATSSERSWLRTASNNRPAWNSRSDERKIRRFPSRSLTAPARHGRRLVCARSVCTSAVTPMRVS
jgi:integrase